MTAESPCVGICILEDDVCIGCGRTSAEIFQAGVEAGFEESPPPKPAKAEED